MNEIRSYCGQLTSENVGNTISLYGWVHSIRDLGGITFIQVRDITGIVQVVIDSSENNSLQENIQSLKSEYVVHVSGTVQKRSEEAINPDIPTGMIEIIVETIECLNTSEVPPFPIDSREKLGEEIRLKYRFLDLRREEMKDTIIKRHISMQTIRNYLVDNRFLEIETPILNKSTPEGARDFLVPSRMNRGKFYALPQSPQLFKQILMVAGYERYFQIVKCFRDEDLRHDRQPEFTQVDLEMSFVDPPMVMEIIEGLLKAVTKETVNIDIETPFEHLTYEEAINRFGTDAPDTRFGMELVDCTAIFSDSEFKVFTSALENEGSIKGIAAPDKGSFSRKIIDAHTEHVKKYGAKGLPFVKFNGADFEGGISKFLSDNEKKSLSEAFKLNEPTIIFFASDTLSVVSSSLGALRLKIAKDLNMIDPDKLNFLWVTDFPLFDYDDETKSYHSVHHPFTSPVSYSIDILDSSDSKSILSMKAQAYDVVLNGVEIGGGSIRIHKQEIQKRIFKLLGISDEEAREKFSFLLDALQYGAPPHGGIALGLDRVIMILLKKGSIRDVIPFPKTQKGQCLMSDAPTIVSEKQLKELAIKELK